MEEIWEFRRFWHPSIARLPSCSGPAFYWAEVLQQGLENAAADPGKPLQPQSRRRKRDVYLLKAAGALLKR